MANPASVILSGGYPLPTDNTSQTAGRLYLLTSGFTPLCFFRDSGSSWIQHEPFGWIDVATYIASFGDPSAVTTTINSLISTAYAAGGGFLWFRPGITFPVTTLNLKDNVILGGVRGASVLHSAANASIITVPTTATNAGLIGLTVEGEVAAGSSQIGLDFNGDADYSGLMVRDVEVKDCGDHGLKLGEHPFSPILEGIHLDNCADYPVLIDSPYAPGLQMRDCYVHTLRSGAGVAYRLKQGKLRLVNCTGVDNSPSLSGSKWAVIGKKNGVDGDGADHNALLTLVNCNLESWHSHGVLAYYNSVVNALEYTSFAGSGSNSNQIGIEYDLSGDESSYYSPFIQRGYIEDTVDFADGAAAYKNSQPIHANGMAPIMVRGMGPLAGNTSNPRINAYRYATGSKDLMLARADGSFAIQTVNAAATFKYPGAREYWINNTSGGAIEVRIPWAGWYNMIQEEITIKDVGGNAATHNITIKDNGTSTTVCTLNVNGQAFKLTPDGNTGAGTWHITGKYL